MWDTSGKNGRNSIDPELAHYERQQRLGGLLNYYRRAA
jgi:hypothetical protein